MNHHSWQLLKTELRYNTVGMLIGYGVCTFFFTINIIFSFGNFHSFLTSTAITFFISIGVIGSEGDKELRDRQQSLLPVRQKEASLSRLMFVLVFQLGVFAFWLVGFILEYPDLDDGMFWVMLSANGIILTVLSQFIFMHDLGFFFTNKYRFQLVGILLLGALMLVLMFYLGALQFDDLALDTFGSALFLNLIWLILFYLDHLIFTRRKAYLA